MPGAELCTSAGDGHVGVAVRGDLDMAGAADAGAAITALAGPGRCLIIDMPVDVIDGGSLAAVLRVQRPPAVSTACPGRAAPSRTGTGDRDRDGFPARLEARMRPPAPGRAGPGGRACQPGAGRGAGSREQKEA